MHTLQGTCIQDPAGKDRPSWLERRPDDLPLVEVRTRLYFLNRASLACARKPGLRFSPGSSGPLTDTVLGPLQPTTAYGSVAPSLTLAPFRMAVRQSLSTPGSGLLPSIGLRSTFTPSAEQQPLFLNQTVKYTLRILPRILIFAACNWLRLKEQRFRPLWRCNKQSGLMAEHIGTSGVGSLMRSLKPRCNNHENPEARKSVRSCLRRNGDRAVFTDR